jgi:hypothetical protein
VKEGEFCINIDGLSTSDANLCGAFLSTNHKLNSVLFYKEEKNITNSPRQSKNNLGLKSPNSLANAAFKDELKQNQLFGGLRDCLSNSRKLEVLIIKKMAFSQPSAECLSQGLKDNASLNIFRILHCEFPSIESKT